MDGRHWPGGIPSTIRPHPEPQCTGFNFDVATQGFRRFIRENWKPGENESDEGFEYEDTQRRKLIETWACPDQVFRENYQNNATSEPPFNRYNGVDPCLRGIPENASVTNCYCIASIRTREDHGRMVKALLLMFLWEYCDPEFPPNGPVSMLPPNPASGPITADNFKMARSVECPDLTNMGTTVDGTVVFQSWK
ncbi:hypothetical protein AWENTII_011797 [Aspergillus wentii]